MIHSYDRNRAAKLVPLLESIFAEVADRRQSIRRLERELQRAKRLQQAVHAHTAQSTPGKAWYNR